MKNHELMNQLSYEDPDQEVQVNVRLPDGTEVTGEVVGVYTHTEGDGDPFCRSGCCTTNLMLEVVA